MTKHVNRDGLDNNDDWQTPPYIYDPLHKEFNFDYDPCPVGGTDGLTSDWGKSNFVNPPYNRIDKPKFVKKAVEEWQKGKTVVLLIPSSTGTKDFHKYFWDKMTSKPKTGVEIRFVEGRISFHGFNTKGEWSEKNKGKHDSMLVILRGSL